MIDDNILASKKVAVLFKIQGQENQRFAKGRVAQALLWLVHSGDRGITAAEVSSWALRLGAYVFTLRHDYGLFILTVREPHEGGNHGRYILKTPVEIIQIIPQPSKG